MVLLTSRIHFYEINDQSWFPAYLRAKVQDGLTLMWTLCIPLMQPASPATLVANTLQKVLGDRISDYTYVDFCAGAGGPTPFIEQTLNRRLGVVQDSDTVTSGPDGNGRRHANGARKRRYGKAGVDFVLTDIAPHLEAWEVAAKKSDNLHFISTAIDASNAPTDLLKPLSNKQTNPKVFRLFSLAFHHFDDPLAEKILRNSVETSDGFGIFELQARTCSSMLLVSLMWPLLLVITPFYFWRSPGHLFFTYIIPIIPFVLVFDGYVSSLRTRTADELLAMVRKGGGLEGWEFASGSECHTFPIGEMTYFSGMKMR